MVREPKMKRSRGIYVCVVCGDPLNELTIQHQDPFCKAKCAHAWYSLDFSVEPTKREGSTNGR